MSLFHDDFYSTKTTMRGDSAFRRHRRFERKPWGRNRWFGLVFLSGAVGVLCTVFVLSWFAGDWGSGAPKAIDNVVPTSTGRARDWDNRVVAAGEKVRPSVVSIISLKKDAATGQSRNLGLGSGVIFQKAGDKARIVTNNHVVDGGTSFEIILSNKERRKAELIGRDNLTDLAVLEIDAAGIKTVATFGNSDTLKPGQTAIAIGNPMGLDFSQTITLGIISSPKRTIPVNVGSDGEIAWEMDVIQTDAAINSGNSGGPLVNINGQVIGINSLKIAESGVEGLGFAIPINDVKPILELLIRDHKVKRPYMGVALDDLQSYRGGLDNLKLPVSVKSGVIVLEVTGPAKEAGIKTGDVVTELDGNAVSSNIMLRKYLFSEKKIGDKLNLTLYRAGKKMNVTLTLGELPEK